MAGEWIDTSLGQVVELKRGYDLPQQDRRTGSIPIVSSSGITDHHSESMVTGPGVVTGRYGTLGEVFFIREDFWPLNTTLYVKDFKGNDPRFISYFLRSIDFIAYSDKAAVPGLNRNHLHQARVRVPSNVNEQRTIAHILGTLDDKIELNKRMNETLEATARAIFKSWFIDFDPVRAKAEGRDTGLPRHIADLFPDSFEDSELGEIPKGWPCMPLNEVFRETNERVREAEVPEYSSTNDGLQPRSKRFTKKLAASNSNNKLIRRGYFVFGLSRRVLNFGLMMDDIGSVSSAYKVFTVEQPSIHPDLLERMMRLRSAYFYNAVSSSSREGQSISSEGLGWLKFIQPSTDIQEMFRRVVAPVHNRMLMLQQESHGLACLRDTLLPPLLSGSVRLTEITIPDKES